MSGSGGYETVDEGVGDTSRLAEVEDDGAPGTRVIRG